MPSTTFFTLNLTLFLPRWIPDAQIIPTLNPIFGIASPLLSAAWYHGHKDIFFRAMTSVSGFELFITLIYYQALHVHCHYAFRNETIAFSKGFLFWCIRAKIPCSFVRPFLQICIFDEILASVFLINKWMQPAIFSLSTIPLSSLSWTSNKRPGVTTF